MATKLSTSLRNSVSAEKNSLNEKKFTVDEKTKDEIQAAKSQGTQALKAEAAAAVAEQAAITSVEELPAKAVGKPVRKLAPKSAAKEKSVKPLKSSLSQKVEAPVAAKAPLTNSSVQGTFAMEQSLSGIKEGMERLSAVSGELSNTYIASLQTMNATINDYLQKLSSVKDFTGIYNANLELLTQLRNSQQDLWQKNSHFFENIKQFVVPKLK